MSSSSTSWSCTKCTLINPHTSTFCQACNSMSPWNCLLCTFANTSAAFVKACEVCGNPRGSGSVSSGFVDLEPEPEELAHPAVGSVFLPLKQCGAKRKDSEKRKDSDDEVVEVTGDMSKANKVSRVEKGKGVEEDTDVAAFVVLDDNYMTSNQSTLKILSYNVWFREDLEVHKRMQALGNLIQKHSPDIICLQEVTPNIYEIFEGSSWWQSYKCSLPKQIAVARPYFCMQMSRLPVKQFSCKEFSNSIMGRELCIADINIGDGKKIAVATTHLESPCPAPPRWDQMYSKERVAQAKEAINILKDIPNVVFAGDMNWDDKLDGTFPVSDEWFDAWLELRHGENGYTYDTKANKMLSGNRTLQKRLDRFICKLNDFKVDSIEMIGTEAIPGLSYCKEKKVKNELRKLMLPVLPSDHYGLLITLSSL